MDQGIANETLSLFDRGRAAFDRGDKAEARPLLEKFAQVCESTPVEEQNNERQFVAYLCLYHCTQGLTARSYLEKCTTLFPQRVEGWYYTMMYYLDRGNHLLATSYGQSGVAEIRKLRKAGTFREVVDKRLYLNMEPDIYTFRTLSQAAISAYYVGWYKEAYDLSQEILDEDVPAASRSQHESNIGFYKSKISEDKHAIVRQDVSDFPAVENFKPTVMAIDNFLKDPDSRREFALQQEFEVKGNYPGARTKSFATEEDKTMLERALGIKISFWPEGYNGSFQYTTGEMTSWIHRDATEFSALLFLTPDAPVGAGTTTYWHKTLKKTRRGTDEDEAEYNKDSYKEEAWDVLDKVGNMYNRLIVFQGKQSHRSSEYFGDALENGRLFQVFFFNAE